MSTLLEIQTKPVSSFTSTRSTVLQRQCACSQHTGGGECAECKKQQEGTLQRAAVNSAFIKEVPPIVHDVLNSPGQPLDTSIRTFMEPRFGHDFSRVRVYTDARAAESARSVNALAYTVGRNVVFGTGQYAPWTSEGRQLLAHELTHVVQQSTTSAMTLQRRRRSLSDEAEMYYQLRMSGVDTAINNEVDHLFWMQHATEIPHGIRIDPANPKHKYLVRPWLTLRDSVIKGKMHGSLGVAATTSHWEFFISGNRIMAVPTPGASCSDLANGTICQGTPDTSNPIDITGAFPEWVSQALADQAASGIRFIQQNPEDEVSGYHASKFDLGYGNCHGFSFQLFHLFADVPITRWDKTGPGSPSRGTLPLPQGLPTQFRLFPPREQLINPIHDSDQEPKASAVYRKVSETGGYRWSAYIEVGDQIILKRIKSIGGILTNNPNFGDLGILKGKDMDHSVIALGRVGNDRIYVLQKMSPLNPYYINVRTIAEFNWYQKPPICQY